MDRAAERVPAAQREPGPQPVREGECEGPGRASPASRGSGDREGARAAGMGLARVKRLAEAVGADRAASPRVPRCQAVTRPVVHPRVGVADTQHVCFCCQKRCPYSIFLNT